MNLSLSLIDAAAIAPLLIVLAGALILILMESFFEEASQRFSSTVALATLLIALYAAVAAPGTDNPLLTDWLRFDHLAHFFTIFFLAIGMGSIFLASSFFHQFEAPSKGEYYFLLLACLFGLILVGASADFLTLFLGIETLSISLYILCGYMKKWRISQEASLKYFLMGSLATAFLIYGIALIYGAAGSTRFDAILPAYRHLAAPSHQVLFLAGVAFITLGLAFKAAIVPFHAWAPDVYEGAATPVTAFMAIGTKAGAFAALIRVFMDALPLSDAIWSQGLAFLAFPTLIYANMVALRQTQLRRFFAYSGISHAGFLLIPLAAGGEEALSALLFYLVVYALATFGCFAVMAFLDHRMQGVVIHDLFGLFKRSPFKAAVLTLCLLTLAGIPPTAGFFAKFYVFKVAIQSGYYALTIVALLTTILSAFYYLRIVAVMYTEKADESRTLRYFPSSVLVGAVACICIVLLSVYPEPLLSFLSRIP